VSGTVVELDANDPAVAERIKDLPIQVTKCFEPGCPLMMVTRFGQCAFHSHRRLNAFDQRAIEGWTMNALMRAYARRRRAAANFAWLWRRTAGTIRVDVRMESDGALQWLLCGWEVNSQSNHIIEVLPHGVECAEAVLAQVLKDARAWVERA
jgi:hypothetical protein